jgi:hypothetical protein
VRAGSYAPALTAFSQHVTRLDAFLDRREAQFLEAADLDLGERLERELGLQRPENPVLHLPSSAGACLAPC